MWSAGHFSVSAFGNLSALNINFANVLRKATAGMYGGSIYNSGGALRLVGCLFYNNTIVGGTTIYGGAVYSSSGAVSLDSCAYILSWTPLDIVRGGAQGVREGVRALGPWGPEMGHVPLAHPSTAPSTLMQDRVRLGWRRRRRGGGGAARSLVFTLRHAGSSFSHPNRCV